MDKPYQDLGERVAFHDDVQGLRVNSNAQSWLYSAKGWVRFLSVLGFIGFALMLIWAITMMTAFGYLGNAGVFGGVGVIMFILMSAMTIVTFMLSLRLSKYSSAIGRMQQTGQPMDFEVAMIQQMKFWRLAGILVLISLAFFLIALISGLMGRFL